MSKKRFLTVFTIFLFCLPSFLFGDIFLGMRICNNRWQKTWLYTSAPEVTLAYRLCAIQFDGAIGTYQPAKYPDTYSIQSRFSVIPMLRFTPGPLIFQMGYGLSYKFLRDEFQITSDQYRFSSTKKWEGEFRCQLGIQFPISNEVGIYLTGGYDYIDEDNYSFSTSGGISIRTFLSRFKEPQKDISFFNPVDTPKKENEQSPKLEIKTPIKTVSLIQQKDPVIMDFNTTIESAFMTRGIEVVNWDKLKMDVFNALKHDSLRINPEQDFESLIANDIQLASFASKIMPIDALIQTQLYYDYETYGKDIFILTASIKLFDPKTGQILSIIQYDGNRTPFPKLKKKVTVDIWQMLENWH